MSELSQVRALHRGLDVLEFLGEHGPSSLHQIHLGTELPKSSLRRLLATLVERRFIRVGLSDGMYRSNIATPRGVDTQHSVRIGRLVEIARPYLLELTLQVKWPAHLHIFVGNRMRIIESTHGQSPLGAAHGMDVETELNMFVAASGLAWLACLPDAEALRIAEGCRADEFATPERYGVTNAVLVKYLAGVRGSGFATRKTSQLRPDGRSAIAVAIREKGRPAGAIAIAWPRDFMDADAFAARHLQALLKASSSISHQLEG